MAVGAANNMTVSWRHGCAGAAQGGEMIVLLQVVGVVAALIGVVALYYGIPVKEFSFGNTLILVGTISLCTGAILFALSVVALEVRAGNEGAQIFYKRMGYRTLVHLTGYYQGIEAALRMGRDLSCQPLDHKLRGTR